MTNISKEPITFRTDDGVTLGATLYRPQQVPKRVVVLSGGTGIPEGFYRRFATWLAQDKGMACLSYTYRDMQDPSPAKMRVSRATMADWGILDGQGARDAARAIFPDLEMWVIGHSLGAMCLSKQPRLDGITRVIAICSGLVDQARHPFPFRFLVYLFWHVIGPISTSILGYLPGQTIGLGSTVPASAFWQWRRWCTSGRLGVLADDSLPPSDWSRSGAPVKIVATRDDLICPPPCARHLEDAFDSATVTHLVLDPADKGEKSLGHLGVFSRTGAAFWDDILA